MEIFMSLHNVRERRGPFLLISSSEGPELSLNERDLEQVLNVMTKSFNERREFQNYLTTSNPQKTLSLKEWNWQLVNPRYKYLIKQALFITASAMGAVALPWKLPRIYGVTVLTAVVYGVINNLFACRVCPEFFTVGQIYDGQRLHHRLVKTLDPNVNALAWGTVASSTFAAIGGTFLSVGASVFEADEKLVIISIVCYAALTWVVADLSSRLEKARLERNTTEIYPGVPMDYQARWHANTVRNSIGYVALISGAIAMCIIMTKII